MRLGLAAFYFAMGLTFAGWASRIPDVQQALGLSNGVLGMALFAIPAGQLVMMGISGYLVARLGSRLTTATSLLMYALALCTVTLASNFATLFAALFFFGAMANMLNISVNTQAVFLEKLYGRAILSSFHGLWSLGGLTGGIVGSLFAATTLPLAFHYLSVFMVAAVTVALCSRYLLGEEPESAGSTATHSFSWHAIEGLIVVLGITAFAGMFCEGTVYDWSGVYFARVVKPDAAFVRAGYIAAMAAMTCGRFVADRFVSRYGATEVLRTCGLFIVVGLAVVVGLPHLVPATLGFLLVGIGISSIVPICYSVAGEHTTMKVSTAITLVSSVSFVGFLIGPPIIGLVSEVLGLRVAVGLATVFGLTIALLAGVVKRKL